MGPMISVTIDSPNPDLGPHWDDLVRRASSNVFMNPAALEAACATGFARIEMLLAWEEGAGGRKLVGVWALRLRKMAPFWPTVLEALLKVSVPLPALVRLIEPRLLLPEIVTLPFCAAVPTVRLWLLPAVLWTPPESVIVVPLLAVMSEEVAIVTAPPKVLLPETFRSAHPHIPVRILTTDPALPYAKPPLSKDYLCGRDAKLDLHSAAWFDRNEVDLIRGITINHVLLQRHIDTLQKHITGLDRKNARLQRWVIALAVAALISTVVQSAIAVLTYTGTGIPAAAPAVPAPQASCVSRQGFSVPGRPPFTPMTANFAGFGRRAPH